MSQLIAIDPQALDALRVEIEKLHKRLDAVHMAPRPEWVTITDYAAHVNRTKRTVRNWINEGSVETKREGGVTLVRLSQGA